MSRIHRILSSVSILSALALGVGGLALASPEARTEAAGAHGAHHGRRAGGGLVHAALRLPSLRAGQRAQLELLVDEEKAAHATVRVAHGDLMQSLAAGVEVGRIDDAALRSKVEAVAQAEAAAKPRERAAVEQLHGILDTAQRAELVTALEARRASPVATGDAEPEHARRGGRGMEAWARALDLTPQQRDQIRANLGAARDAGHEGGRQAHGAARAEHEKVLEAFKADRFVMNEVAPPAVGAEALERGPEKLVAAVRAALPVLTPPQRAAAAARMRAEAQRAARD